MSVLKGKSEAKASPEQTKFELLVDELMMDNPDQKKVKQLCFDLNLPFDYNSSRLMGSVLESAHRIYLKDHIFKSAEGDL